MSDFKLTIADPKTGKTYQTEVKDSAASGFVGLNIGEKVKGDDFGLAGAELEITGGSDHCGFPMRKGILGIRKRIAIMKGVGFSGGRKGMKKRKTVCGFKIHDKISQINLKVIKEGSKKPSDVFGKKEEKAEGKEEPKAEKK
jgi:small subunit ribosomal protein S6e